MHPVKRSGVPSHKTADKPNPKLKRWPSQTSFDRSSPIGKPVKAPASSSSSQSGMPEKGTAHARSPSAAAAVRAMTSKDKHGPALIESWDAIVPRRSNTGLPRRLAILVNTQVLQRDGKDARQVSQWLARALPLAGRACGEAAILRELKCVLEVYGRQSAQGDPPEILALGRLLEDARHDPVKQELVNVLSTRLKLDLGDCPAPLQPKLQACLDAIEEIRMLLHAISRQQVGYHLFLSLLEESRSHTDGKPRVTKTTLTDFLHRRTEEEAHRLHDFLMLCGMRAEDGTVLPGDPDTQPYAVWHASETLACWQEISSS